MNRDAAIKAAYSALSQHRVECTGLGEVTCAGCRDRGWMSWYDFHTHIAAAVIDAAAPHLAPDVETIAATLALAYGGHVSPPRGGRDWKAAEAVHALLVPVDEP